MKRTGCDVTVANEILACARDSFAQWPVRRELTLCDVVHYLSMTEFLLAHEDESWIHTNLALSHQIPHPKSALRCSPGRLNCRACDHAIVDISHDMQPARQIS